MSLCRIYVRGKLRRLLPRTSQHILSCEGGNKLVLLKPIASTVNYGDFIRCHSNSSLYIKEKKFSNHESWQRWKVYLLAAIGIGGASALFESWNEELHCAETSPENQDQKVWKDVKVTLYQYQTCPFCTKVRTFLIYKQIPFEIVEVHPIFKKEIKFSEKYKKVPIVTIDTKDGKEELQDSSLIISILSTYMKDGGKKKLSGILKEYPSSEIITEEGKKQEVVLNKYWVLEEEPDKPTHVSEDDMRRTEVMWREWTDDHLVHLISPNVYRTYREAYQAFAHHVKQGKFNGTWEGVVAKVFGSTAMWLISKKLKKKYNMRDDVRVDLYLACNEWCDAMGKKKFMGGDEPNLADLSVYAVLSVMEGLVSFEDMAKYTRIKPWYYRMKKVLEKQQQLASSTDNQILACMTSTVPSG
ncbi:prostaglandin E synthase 2-like [Styela clava]